MSNILAFHPRPRVAVETALRICPEGKVVIFPGVRYERQDPAGSGTGRSDPGRRDRSPSKPSSKGAG